MTSPEKLRRRKIVRDLQSQEQVRFAESFPTSPELIRDLFDFLDQSDACDSRLTLTMQFIKAHRLPAEPIVEWLNENAGLRLRGNR